MRLGNLPHQLELRDNSGLETTLRTDKKKIFKKHRSEDTWDA